MMIVFAIIVILVMVVPSTVPSVVGCVPPKKRAAPIPASPTANPPTTPAPATGSVGVHTPNAPVASIVLALSPTAIVSGPWISARGDPAYWKPTSEDIAAVQAADLIVLNGAGYEPWAQQAALPRARTIELAQRVADRLITEQGDTHSHGPEGEHSHAGFAFTTWLSPAILREEARALANELARLRPLDRQAIEARLVAVNAKLDALDAELGALAKLQPAWLGSHPVYQYLAQAGGLTIDCVHWEPGEMPGDDEWVKFRQLRSAAPKPTAWMLWEGEPGQAIRDRLKAEGVEVVVFSPLGAGDSAERDFLAYFGDRVQAMRAAVTSR